MKATWNEINLMVSLSKLDLTNSGEPCFPEKIRENIWKIFEKDVSLHDIYYALDMEYNEDFELESRKHSYVKQIYI